MGGGDKHGSKSGRYVGGLLQLFDWNAKSRKKLFSSKPDSPEPKQGKKIEVDEEEFVTGLSIRGGSDYSCASSVTDEDSYGTKAPNVVARLMGLDSLPTSISLEPYSTPFFDTLSLQDATFRRKNIDCSHDHHQMMQSRHTLDITRSQKFQTEILPPKSAKMIPITRNKLLSPIKSPIFVPSQDAAYIMEAAAKIIEPGPQAATPRTRLSSSSSRSSSVSFKVRELKEKLEGAQPQKPLAQRPVESNAVKYLTGQPMNKSWNGSSLDTTTFKVSPSRDDGVKNKGKSISLAIQAKVNVQKREGLARRSGSEEQDDSKSIIKTQPKITNRKLSSSSVLRQNNQKQNSSSSSTYRDKHASKKKTVSEDSSSGRQKSLIRDTGPSRNAPRKSSLQRAPYSGVRNLPRKKRSIDNNSNSDSNSNSNSKVSDRQFSWIEESRRKGMDVVSFTFTAPITRSLSGSELSKQQAEKSSNLSRDDRGEKWLNSDVSRPSSPGLNGIGCDSLSNLLEQKLKELTSNFETSVTTKDSARQTVISGPKKYNFQGMETMDSYGSTVPSPVSILEPSILTESCYSSESFSTEGSKQCSSSVQTDEVLGLSSLQKHQTTETKAIDTLDSASSTSSLDSMKSTAWELGYVKDILSNAELMFKDYATGRTREIVNPHLFDQMERRQVTRKVESRLERKVLFDCVSECLELRCQRFVGGGFETWTKGIATVKRKERLTEEVFKEIEGWRSLGNSMVDELVDKDMGSKYGGWLDFEADEFMLGEEIQNQILDSLIEEIVADALPYNSHV